VPGVRAQTAICHDSDSAIGNPIRPGEYIGMPDSDQIIGEEREGRVRMEVRLLISAQQNTKRKTKTTNKRRTILKAEEKKGRSNNPNSTIDASHGQSEQILQKPERLIRYLPKRCRKNKETMGQVVQCNLQRGRLMSNVARRSQPSDADSAIDANANYSNCKPVRREANALDSYTRIQSVIVACL